MSYNPAGQMFRNGSCFISTDRKIFPEVAMTIAPLAALGIAKTAFSVISALADHARQPSPEAQTRQTGQVQESIWHQVGQAVDVRSMTQDDLAKVSSMLYDNGLISLSDHATLSFDPSFAGSAGLLTTPDASGQVDWVAEFQARLARHNQDGDSRGAAQDQRVLDILGRLQAGARGVTSIRV